MKKLIELRNVSFRYSSRSDWILKNINLKIHAGEIVVITGKSGSGKSTLLKIINGIIPEILQGEISGDILYGNASSKDINYKEKISKCSTAFQNPELQLLNNFVFEEFSENNNSVLQRLGIEDLYKRRIFELSGGEKQKVAIVSVLASRSPVKIFDEPSANMDDNSKTEFYKILQEIKQKKNTAFVIAEHWFDEIKKIADKIYRVDNTLSECGDSYDNVIETNIIYSENEVETRKNSLLEIKDLTVKIDKKPVFENINFKINPGEIVGLTGPNGSGKTTLAHAISGIKKADSGEIIFSNNKDFRIGLLLQNPYHQVFGYSVKEEIIFGMKNFRIFTNSKTNTLLKDFELDKISERPVYSLSHGEVENTMIAATFAIEPELLILDEPFQGIGVNGVTRIINYLNKDIKRDMSILFITHNKKVLEKVCSKIFRLENGKLYDE